MVVNVETKQTFRNKSKLVRLRRTARKPTENYVLRVLFSMGCQQLCQLRSFHHLSYRDFIHSSYDVHTVHVLQVHQQKDETDKSSFYHILSS